MNDHCAIRREPIFSTCTPVLFAHRGGAREAPESTRRAFDHGLDVGSDVLELDIQMTADRKIVVWHGPDVDNVYIPGLTSSIVGRWWLGKRNIDQLSWQDELEGNAFVQDPGSDEPLDATPKEDSRAMMLLSAFLSEYPDAPLNIEIKSTFKGRNARELRENIAQLLDVLSAGRGGRPILVVSSSSQISREFRRQQDGSYPTGLSSWEALRLSRLDRDALSGRALESTRLVWPTRIDTMRKAGGATFAFVTKFGPIRGLDTRSPVDARRIRKLLDRGVDGIMTDRPREVRPIIDAWLQSR